MPDKNQIQKNLSFVRKAAIPYLLLDRDLYLLEASGGADRIVPQGEDSESSLSGPLGEALGLPDISEACETVINTGAALSLDTHQYSVRIESVHAHDTSVLLVSFLELDRAAPVSEDPTTALLEAMPDPVLMTDENFSITAFNSAACHFFLLTRAEMKHTSAAELIQSEDGKESSFLPSLKSPGRPQIITLTLPAKGLVKTAVQIRPRPAKDDGWAFFIKNISRETFFGEREKIAHVKLAVFNDNLRRLTALAAHDMKEPLIIASIYAELLLEKNREHLDGESAGYVASIMEMVRRMVSLIDNLVALVRMDTTRPLVPVDAGAVCDEAVKKCKGLIEKTGVRVSRDALPQVMGNKILLTQLFYHLISNAVKFSAGKEGAEVRITQEENGTEFVRISVTDPGVGFDGAQAEKIFELFERFHDKETYPGFGTGLTLARKITAAHGGRIWGESSPGTGSVFHFTVRLASK